MPASLHLQPSQVAGAALVLAVGLVLVPAGPGLGHEERAAGEIGLVVGWGQEPAYTGFPNSVQVRVTDGGAPVSDLAGSLSVEVIKGDERLTLPLEPASGPAASPGEYGAPLVPTRPGRYTFRVTGMVRGQPVNESFTSSPTTFDEVQDAGSVQFPARDPSPGQVATRIDREVPRLHDRADQIEGTVERARALAWAGLGAGALGLLAAGASLVALRRTRAPAPAAPRSAGDGGTPPTRGDAEAARTARSSP